MSALHVFDMDGTLLRGTSASLILSERLGLRAELEALEAEFLGGSVDSRGFAAGVRELWTDLTPEIAAAVAADGPWIDGIEEVCADIRARGERSMLITLSPDFFARHLLGYGVDVVRASVFPPLPLTVDIDLAGVLNPEDKVRLAEAERVELGLPTSACVAYGDSYSDVPLFQHLEHTVAVNADPDVEAAAAAAYRGEDLREAYRLGRSLLTSA